MTKKYKEISCVKCFTKISIPIQKGGKRLYCDECRLIMRREQVKRAMAAFKARGGHTKQQEELKAHSHPVNQFTNYAPISTVYDAPKQKEKILFEIGEW